MNETNLPAGQANTSKYNLDLAVPGNDAIANGTAHNTAGATLTLDGNPQASQAITFKITSGGAKFSNGKQQIDNQMTNSSGYVQVPFVDTSGDAGDTGKIVASMTNNPVVSSSDVDYSFISIRKIAIFPSFNMAPADNDSQNRVLVALMDNASGSVDTSYSGSIVFTADDSNVKFVGTNTVPLTRGFADLPFVYSVADSASHTVTVTAALSGGGAPSAQQEFAFNGGKYGFWASSAGALVGQDMPVTYAPGDETLNIDLLMTLPAESESYFISQQPNPWVKVINEKVTTSKIGPASQTYGSVVVTCNVEELTVMFNVSSPTYSSQTAWLTFTN